MKRREKLEDVLTCIKVLQHIGDLQNRYFMARDGYIKDIPVEEAEENYKKAAQDFESWLDEEV